MSDARGVGDRIAIRRKLAGIGQKSLAEKARYSLSTVTKVEQGRIPASPGFIAAVARVLDVEPELFTGAPFYETIEADGPLEGLAELRAILTEGSHVWSIEPGTINELKTEMEAINTVRRNDKGRVALRRLPVLIRQAHGLLRVADSDADRAWAHALLANAYATAEVLSLRFGFISLAPSILDRLDTHASESSDRLYVADAKFQRGRILMYFDSTDVGMSLIEDGFGSIEGSDESALTIRGFGHLCGAIIAARGRNLDTARDHIQEARILARHVTGESDFHGTRFGSANVDIHSCAVELEAGDAEKAAREGVRLTLPKGISPPRAGHHWQDNARAWLLSGQPQAALDSLKRARKVAPQQTRLHPGVRETLHGIARSSRSGSEGLGSFAKWVGVKV